MLPTACFELCSLTSTPGPDNLFKCFQTLDLCYDQIIHPQKSFTVRALLDSVMGRLMELKFEMINLEKSEFHYMDDIISDLGLTPFDVEITGTCDRCCIGNRISEFY